MATRRFWDFVLGRQYAPSKIARPLFMERRLDNLYGGDKHGKFAFLEPLVRNFPVKRYPEGEPEGIPYEPVSVQPANQLAGAPGVTVHLIEPPLGQLWQLLFMTLRHDDDAGRVFNVDITCPATVLINDEDQMQVPNDIWTPLYPIWHNAPVVFSHTVGYQPLYIDNYHAADQSIAVRGAGMNVGTIVELQYIYNRII